MRAISGAEGFARRPMPGVIGGVITLDSPNIAWTEDYTGVIDMDLTKAALVDIPILDCLDSALGSAQAARFRRRSLPRSYCAPGDPRRAVDARRPAGPASRHRHHRLRRPA